jgi:hypothetical protein
MGDWTNSGTTGIGVFDPRSATWYLRKEASAGGPDAGQFQYGGSGWVPVVGDWNHTGHLGIGVFDPSTGTWYLRNEANAGSPDAGVFQFGGGGWIPVVGDWTGSGQTSIGAFDPHTATWYLHKGASAGIADAGIFQYGGANWKPIVGDWTGTGQTGIGAFDPGSGTWYLHKGASAGAPDAGVFQYGGGNWQPVVSPVASAASPILLPTSTLASLRQQAANKTAQWQAFKSRLDSNLGQNVGYGAYQGSELTWIQDYALGYQILKDTDPLTAANYADKAIALMKSGLHDFQKSDWMTRQFLVRGDGTTTSFTLPNADFNPSTLRVYLGSVSSTAVVHGAANSADNVGYYSLFLKVSNTADGTADYTQGVDWSHNSNLSNNLLDWSPAGKEPAAGATYYVTTTSAFGAPQASVTVNGTTITFATAPGKDKAVFVEYIYGKHSADGSTLAYQQTSSGDGGFNSIMVDDTYTSRYLGKYLALGLDWLSSYRGFSPALQAETAAMFVRWSDFVRDSGYASTSPASNYGAGGYVSRVFTALALAKRSPQGPRLMQEVLNYRTTYLLPDLTNSTASLKGGFWAEGWSYGQLATQNVLLAGLALEEAGDITATAERQWASDVVKELISASPSAGTIYDGGDWFASPAPFPANELLDVLGAMASDSAARSYANYLIQHNAGSNTNDAVDLLYRNPAASAAFWSALPLQWYAQGTGLLTARSDWGTTPTWVSAQIGNPLAADHQSFTPGQVQIQRGADDLLVNANALGDNQSGVFKSTYGNTIVVDDNGEGAQTYRYSMGVWYGSPGVVTTYEAGANYTYLSGDYHAAYSSNLNPGGGGSTSELNREVVYLNPNYVVIYDRVTTIKDYYVKQQRWHFAQAPTVSGNSFVETVGTSRLFGQTFSTVPLTTTLAPVQVGNATVQELITQNASPTASVRYVTAFQVAPSTTAAMDSTSQILSTDSRMEGTQVGNQVVLFGRNGVVDATVPVTYSLAGGSATQNLLADLQAGKVYQIAVNGVNLTTVTASAKGLVSFSTPAAGGTVVVTKIG